jgi:predicted small lipoprotein YifL
MKRTLFAATALALAATLTGCGGDDEPESPGSDGPPTTAPSTSPPQSSSPSPTVDRDAWREKFADKQLREFDYALREWQKYGRQMDAYRSHPPENPEEVRRLFEKYSYNATALFDSYVMNYVEGGVRIVTPPEPLYITGRKIEVNKKGSLVEFDQCTDYTRLDIRRDGKPVKGAAPTTNDTAIIRAQMAYAPATETTEGGWRVLSSKVVDKPCE